MQFPRSDHQWGDCLVMTLFTFTETSRYDLVPLQKEPDHE